MRRSWIQFGKDQSGATAVEYAMLIGLISLALLAVIIVFDEQLLKHWTLIVDELNEAAESAT